MRGVTVEEKDTKGGGGCVISLRDMGSYFTSSVLASNPFLIHLNEFDEMNSSHFVFQLKYRGTCNIAGVICNGCRVDQVIWSDISCSICLLKQSRPMLILSPLLPVPGRCNCSNKGYSFNTTLATAPTDLSFITPHCLSAQSAVANTAVQGVGGGSWV